MQRTFNATEVRMLLLSLIILGMCFGVFLWGSLFPIAWQALVEVESLQIFMDLEGWRPLEILIVQAALVAGIGVGTTLVILLWAKVVWRWCQQRRWEWTPPVIALCATLLVGAVGCSLKPVAWQGVVRRVRIETRMYELAGSMFYQNHQQAVLVHPQISALTLITNRFVTKGDGRYITRAPGYGLLGKSVTFWSVYISPNHVRLPLSISKVAIISAWTTFRARFRDN